MNDIAPSIREIEDICELLRSSPQEVDLFKLVCYLNLVVSKHNELVVRVDELEAKFQRIGTLLQGFHRLSGRTGPG